MRKITKALIIAGTFAGGVAVAPAIHAQTASGVQGGSGIMDSKQGGCCVEHHDGQGPHGPDSKN